MHEYVFTHIIRGKHTIHNIQFLITDSSLKLFSPQFILIMKFQENKKKDRENIIKLASEIEEVNEIFIDLANLVNTQGESIENIETSIESTQKFTDSANTQLLQAKTYQKKTRCCNKLICICSSIIITIITLIIVTIPMS